MTTEQSVLSAKVKETVLKVDIEEKESIMNYSFGRKRNFLKLFVALPKLVPTCRSNSFFPWL
jgi:hypothetical protein